MNGNLVGSIYGRFSIKIAYFVLILQETRIAFDSHVYIQIGMKLPIFIENLP
jgi:hypothetical protein